MLLEYTCPLEEGGGELIVDSFDVQGKQTSGEGEKILIKGRGE